MRFKLKADKRALDELQKQVDFYNEQQRGLGKRFKDTVSDAIKSIRKNPFYTIRYDYIRCFPLNKFPFMLHFTVDEKEKIVFLHAIINTSKKPETSWVK